MNRVACLKNDQPLACEIRLCALMQTETKKKKKTLGFSCQTKTMRRSICKKVDIIHSTGVNLNLQTKML